jgi:glutamyl-tRNA reductase
MQILVVGLSHETAPLEIRERLALGNWQFREALISLCDYVPQGIILSTCNRTEVYAVTDESCCDRRGVYRFLCEFGGISEEQLSPYLYEHTGEAAVAHAFRIASGLESMIIGEFEVLGQVRDTLEAAERSGLVGLPLLNLFRQAVRVGRRARRETAISMNPVSVSSVGVELARKTFDDLAMCNVLVISAGEAGQLAVKALAEHGISRIVVASRSQDRAQEVASAYGGKTVPFHRLNEPLMEADIVIGSSGAPHYILEPSDVREAMQSRPERPLVLIDIAVPRDFDPRVREIENVHLYDIDDLKAVSGANRRQRAREIEKVDAIIEDEIDRFMVWWRSLEAVPTITALVTKAERIRHAQVRRAVKKMRVTEDDRAAIDALTQAIVKKILHDPITYLRNGGHGDKHIQAARDLFKLDGDE